MRLNLPDDRRIAVVGGAVLCPATDDWKGLFDLCRDGPGQRLEMELPEPTDRAEARQRRMMSRSAIMSAWVVRRALRETGWSDETERLATGLFMGVGASQGCLDTLEAMLEPSMEDGEFSEERFGREGLAAGNPLFAFQLMNNYTMCHAAILEGLGGPNNAFFSQGAGTAVALIEAAYAVAEGKSEGGADRALAGGADSAHHPVTRSEISRGGFATRGFRGSEAAAVVALKTLDAATSPLATLERAAIYDTRQETAADVARRALEETGRHDLLLIAPWGDPAREILHAASERRGAGVTTVDVTEKLGDSLAATPALSWLVALDALRSTESESAVVLGMGIDGYLTAVAFRSPGGSR